MKAYGTELERIAQRLNDWDEKNKWEIVGAEKIAGGHWSIEIIKVEPEPEIIERTSLKEQAEAAENESN